MREFDEFNMDVNPKHLQNMKTMMEAAEREERAEAEPPSFYNKEIGNIPTWLKISGILFAGLVIPGIIGTMVYFATTSTPTPFNRPQSDNGSSVCYTLYPDIVSWDVAKSRCRQYNMSLPDPNRLDLYQDLAMMTSPLNSLARFPQVLYSGFWVDKSENQSVCRRVEFNIEPYPASTYLSYRDDDCYDSKPLVCQRNDTDMGICREHNYAKKMLPSKLVNYLFRSREAAQVWGDACYSIYRLKVEYEVAHLFCSQIKSNLLKYDEDGGAPWEWINQKYSSVYPEAKEHHLWTYSKLYPPCKGVKVHMISNSSQNDFSLRSNNKLSQTWSEYYCQTSLLVVCQGPLYEPCPGEDINDLL